MGKNQKVLFMGSPDYAVPILEMLHENYPVVAVVTQPDKPVGRGKKIQSPPVKVLAEKLGLTVLQPKRIKGKSFMEELEQLAPDVIIVAAYGKILPKSILDFPKYGCVNVHASMLPKWRGASPIQYAIWKGDAESGVTIMLMDEGVDTGGILAQRSVKIVPAETTESLAQKLSHTGTELLQQTLPDYLAGKLEAVAQREEEATFTRMLDKADGELDFSQPAETLERQVRALNPWPICYFKWNGNHLRVIKAEVSQASHLEAGQRGIISKQPCVGTSSFDLKLVEVQPAGKRVMSGKAFLNGARDWQN
jgi:methionyl-tRNA formyltransferase